MTDSTNYPCHADSINIAILESDVQKAIQVEYCTPIDTSICCQIKDPCMDPQFNIIRDAICKITCDNIISWQTFKCLFFNGPGDSFGLNQGLDSVSWGGNLNKMISFDGCYRKMNEKCVSKASCSESYKPFQLTKNIIDTWQTETNPVTSTQCIPPNQCWDPCNRLLIERDLDKICSLHDVMKTCRPTCALTWNEVLRKILQNNPDSLQGEEGGCAIRHPELINGYVLTIDGNRCLQIPAIQQLTVGIMFRQKDTAGCPPILVNFNYHVYFGDPNNTLAGPYQIDTRLFNCICGDCKWAPYPKITHTSAKVTFNAAAANIMIEGDVIHTSVHGLNDYGISWEFKDIIYNVENITYGDPSNNDVGLTVSQVGISAAPRNNFITLPGQDVIYPERVRFILNGDTLAYDETTINIFSDNIVYEIISDMTINEAPEVNSLRVCYYKTETPIPVDPCPIVEEPEPEPAN